MEAPKTRTRSQRAIRLKSKSKTLEEKKSTLRSKSAWPILSIFVAHHTLSKLQLKVSMV